MPSLWGGDQPVRGDLRRPALDVAGRVEATTAPRVEGAAGLGAQDGAGTEDLADIGVGGGNRQLAPLDPPDLGVLAVRAESRVQVAQGSHGRVERGARHSFIAHVDADRGAHERSDEMRHAAGRYAACAALSSAACRDVA